MWFHIATPWYNCFDPSVESWQLVVLAHSSAQWCHQPFKWHTLIRLRPREGGLELSWALERKEPWKMWPEALSGPVGGLCGFGVLWGLKQAAGWSAKLNNPSFLKSAEAAPSGEVPGTGCSICPSRVWLNWKRMELRVWLLMEVNSCLTILPSDVGSRELGKRPDPEECGRRIVFQRSLPSRSVGDLGSSITQQSYAMTCCFHAPKRSGRERCVCLCTTIFAVYLNMMLYGHLPRAVLAGWNTHVASQGKETSSRGNVLIWTTIHRFCHAI